MNLNKPRYVPPFVGAHPSVLLIGEAPGRDEHRLGVSFVGRSWQLIKEWLRATSLTRDDFLIINVYPYYPKVTRYHHIDRIPPERLVDKFYPRLHRFITDHPEIKLIVPTGNFALRALKRKFPKDKTVLITDWRGSIFGYRDRIRERAVKCIATVHPAATFRQPSITPLCQADWKRIGEEYNKESWDLPRYIHHTDPPRSRFEKFLAQVDAAHESGDGWLSIDIETTDRIVCVGFSVNGRASFVVSYPQFKVWAHTLCRHPIRKILQNGHYDYFWLADDGIKIRNYKDDLMWMHSALYPHLEHSLAAMASVDTRQPFWKREHKDEDTIAQYHSQWEAVLSYCGIDNCVTRNLAPIYAARLEDDPVGKFYRRYHRRLATPLADMMMQGIPVDRSTQKSLLKEVKDDCARIRKETTEETGTNLFGPLGISNKKAQEYIYGKEEGQLGLKILRNPKTKRPTLSATALRRLRLRYPHLSEFFQKLLYFSLTRKRIDFLKDEIFDSDDRFRTQFKYAYTGRLTSSSSPRRIRVSTKSRKLRKTGGNIQNQHAATKRMFVPEPGCVFLEVDLSQAEARVVYGLIGTKKMMRRANARPGDLDVHSDTAHLFFDSLSLALEWKDQRRAAKSVRHGINYGEYGQTISDSLLKSDIVIPPKRCDYFRELLLMEEPEIEDVFQRGVREVLMRDGRLVNSWGWRFSAKHLRLDAEVYRKAYAFIPQSEIGITLNMYGLIPLSRYIKKHGLKARINAQVHDSLLISVPPEECYRVARFLQQSLERPRMYRIDTKWGKAKEVVIPCEYKMGNTWSVQEEWKELPSREEITEVAKVMYRGRRDQWKHQ